MSNTLPPNVNASDKVILFDGVCKLCNRWSQFIIQNDKAREFRLCSVQSVEGQQILTHFGYPIDTFETMLLVKGDKCLTQSDAFLDVVSYLTLPWCLLHLFRIIPSRIRNWVYDRIALNRYKLFGCYDSCILPSPDHDKRFLDGGR